MNKILNFSCAIKKEEMKNYRHKRRLKTFEDSLIFEHFVMILIASRSFKEQKHNLITEGKNSANSFFGYTFISFRIANSKDEV